MSVSTEQFADPVLYLQAVDQVFEVYLDGKPVYSFGRLDDSGKGTFAGNPFHLIPLRKGGSKPSTVAMRIYSSHTNIGIYGTPKIAERSTQVAEVFESSAGRIFAGILALFISLVLFAIFLMRRSEVAYLGLALFALSAATFTITRSKLTDFVFGHELLRSYIEHLSLFVYPATFSLYLERVFGAWHGKIIRRIWQFFFLFALISLCLSLSDVHAITLFLPPFWILSALASAAILACVVSYARQGDVDAKIFLLGFGVLTILSCHDILVAARLVPWFFTLMHWGLLLAILTQVGILARRFASVYRRVGRLKLQLERILAGTREMASAREKIDAVSNAVAYVLAEISLTQKPSVQIILATRRENSDGTNRLEGCHALIYSDGATRPERTFAPLDPSEPEWTVAQEAETHAESYLNTDGSLIVPLRWGSRYVGLIRFFSYRLPKLSEEEAHFVDTLASSLALALDNIDFIAETTEKTRLEAEMAAARAVQEALLPVKSQIPGLDLACYSASASETGGDWYGHFYDPASNSALICVGDVTGHGVPSALITGVACGAMFSSDFWHSHSASRLGIKLDSRALIGAIAGAANRAVVNTAQRTEKWMTMFFLHVDLATGEVTYVNAGHVQPFLIRKTPASPGAKSVRLTGTKIATALGSTLDFEFPVEQTRLEPGDMVFLFSDGLIENQGPDQGLFSIRRLKNILENCTAPEEVHERVETAMKAIWKNTPLEDDVTFVCLRYQGIATRQSPLE
jgi:serine phosphatase RsbU (regulator of sigma subunit)